MAAKCQEVLCAVLTIGSVNEVFSVQARVQITRELRAFCSVTSRWCTLQHDMADDHVSLPCNRSVPAE